jgi:hypothetical protein
MLAGLYQPSDVLSIADILKALEIDRGAATEKPDLYVVVPGNSGPRWLIPATSPGAAAVLRAWRPYSLTGRVKWFVIRMAARAGITGLFPTVSSVTISRECSQRWFERCGIEALAKEMVIMVGNPHRDRKLTVFLLDAAYQIAAVLKVGLTPGGRLSVIREAEALRRLEPYHWAPDFLAALPDQGAAAQRFVPGNLPGNEFCPEYLDWLCKLPLSGASLNLSDVASAMEAKLRPFADELQKSAPDLVNRCLSCLDLDADMPTMLVHGDFAPWNIRQRPDGSYVYLDWEWASFTGLPAQDLLHYHFSKSRLLDNEDNGYAVIRNTPAFAEYLARMDIDTKFFSRLAIAYLLERLETCASYPDPAGTSYTLNQLRAVLGS